ncbi:MAG TPA: hypothetical protein VJ777_30250 [Mycobacterium sp.]|nr:hypothetical protein [Mycobacterium sp.]
MQDNTGNWLDLVEPKEFPAKDFAEFWPCVPIGSSYELVTAPERRSISG